MSNVTHALKIKTWLYALVAFTITACADQVPAQPAQPEAAAACQATKDQVLASVPEGITKLDDFTGKDADTFKQATDDTDADDEIIVMGSKDTAFLLYFTKGCFSGEGKVPLDAYKQVREQIFGRGA